MLNFRLARILRARPHLLAGVIIGILGFFVLTPIPDIAIRAITAWDAGSAVYVGTSLLSFVRALDRDISADAKRQQEGEWSVFVITLFGAVMSFAAIFLFSGAASAHKSDRGLYLAFVITTLTLSWLTTHVSFAFRYAHEYYTKTKDGKPDGGIEFPQDDEPDYLDFVYFSFVLGMTFQVSDCNVTSKKFRRLATVQGLIGFLFNTVILALSVNIAASLM